MISFYSEDSDYVFSSEGVFVKALSHEITRRNRIVGDVNYIFCSDAYLLEINKTYLDHNYYTDIITFDYCDKNIVSGDLFISIDTVKFNAGDLHLPFDDELLRVMFHGVLHLLGYKDKDEIDEKVMRLAEDECLSYYHSL